MKNGITYERHKKQSLNIGTSSANLLISWNVLQCRRIDWNQLYFHGECVCYKRLCLKKILRQCKRLRALIFMIWVRRKSWFKTSFGSNLYFRKYSVYTNCLSGFQTWILLLPRRSDSTGNVNTVQSIKAREACMVIGRQIFCDILNWPTWWYGLNEISGQN